MFGGSRQKRKPAQPTWWGGGQDPVMFRDHSVDVQSEVMTDNEEASRADFSFQSLNTYVSSAGATDCDFSRMPTPERDNQVFTVPVRGSETPDTRARFQGLAAGSNTPDLRRTLSHARSEDVHEVALKMFRVLQDHGLVAEAEKAFSPLNEGFEHKPGSDSDDDELRPELTGMEYILKDGIVNYLRDVAKLSPPLPQQVVRFIGINYSAMVQPPTSTIETFGAKLFNCFCGICFSPFRRKEKAVHLDILKDVTGYIMPGSMTLLLGPPGSGKSSLLKVLAGRAETNKNTKLDGTVLFNDRDASEVMVTRLIAYINGQLNKHLPFLTVRETLEFAEDCTQGMRPENFTPQMRKFFAQALVEGQDPYLEYILHVLGLKGIENQLVGSGQDGITEMGRNRLTTAEIAMGTYSVMLYDQPCFGQESLATYDLVSVLRAISRFQQCSAVMSLVQLTPEVYDLFDRITLLSQGQVLYQGPRHDALHYFARLGFKKPAHVDSGDFLNEIAAGEGAQYLEGHVVCPSLADLAKTYKLSDMHKDVLRIVHSEEVVHTFWIESEPNLGLSVKKKSKSSESMRQNDGPDVEVMVSRLANNVVRSRGIESTGVVQVGDTVTGIAVENGDLYYLQVGSKDDQRNRASSVASLLSNARGHVRLQIERIRDPEVLEEEEKQARHFKQTYVQTWKQSTLTLIKRQTKVLKRLTFLIQLRLVQVLILGLFAGTIFWQMGGKYPLAQMNAIRGLGFVTTMNLLLVTLVQLPLYMMQRPVFYKQQEQRFFRVSSYITSQTVVSIPQSLLEALVYSLSVYFMAGLNMNDNGVSFLKYLLIMFLVACLGSSLVLMLSGLTPILEQANSLSGLLVSLFLLFSGFVIYPSNMPKYWAWVAHANPIRWANIAFCVTQFEALYPDPCSDHTDDIHFCDRYPNDKVGHAFLNYYEFPTELRWYWISICIMLAWIALMHFLALLVYNTLRHRSVVPSLPSQSRRVPNIMTANRRSRDSFEQDKKNDGISWAGYVVQAAEIDSQSNIGRYKQVPGDIESFDSNTNEDRSASWKSSNIPVKPMTISFHSLSFEVVRVGNGESKTLLSGVSGYAKPGKMLALMGSNKSGKTTLLRCLANRAPSSGVLSGEILLNGFKLNAATASRVVGFAERLDAHQPFLTVRESLAFSASLRLGDKVKGEGRQRHIDLILDLLDLTFVQHQLVGSLRDATGRTFEIAKKITIAVELAANPSLLFLDEPTSGLDGLGARNVIHAMQTIAATGRTIVSTIQHPSARMLSAFNSVIILKPGGEQVYFGPVGWNCAQLLEYFASIPRVPKFHPDSHKQNPVTFVLDVLGAGIKPRDPKYDFAEVYRNSSLASLNDDELNGLKRHNKRSALQPMASGYAADYKTQALMVFNRTHMFLWRNVGYTFGRLSGCISVGLLLGSVYFQIPQDSASSVTSRSLFIYMQVMLLGVVTATNVVPQLGTDRLAYFREKRASMYAPIFYPVSWAIMEIPYFAIATLFFVAIGNGLAGIGTDTLAHFLEYWLTLFVFTLCLANFGMLLTIATPVPMLASFAVSITTSLWVSASGVVIPKPILNDGWTWLFWANPFQFVTNTLTSIGFYCDTTVPECSLAVCPAGQSCPSCGCAQIRDLNFDFSWDRLSEGRALDYKRIPIDYAALAAMSTLFAVLAFVAFVSLKHNKAQ